jgi:ATP-dependent DNA helicase RecQ
MIAKSPEIILTPTEILKKYWGYSTFRDLQDEIVESVLSAKDTLAIMPTGGGKSVCFQVPGLLLEGVCIVVSPLIALMKDQVNQLQQRGINAQAIYSGVDSTTSTDYFNDAIDGKIKFLYVSPERLHTYAFLNALKYLKIGLLAIDEAHCISKWGYDFRPAYLDINKIRENYQGKAFPTIALTATATEQVRKDIIERLSLKKAAVFIKSFARENLSYHIKKTESKENHLLEYLKRHSGSAIVYAKTRKRTVEMANFLSKNGIPTDHYHAGLSLNERNKKQDDWIKSDSGVIVATNAFGMGIDKANVRTVVHVDLCDNLEAYYQESGRAGRDGKPCSALLLYNDSDILTLEKNLEKKYPEKEVLRKTYQSLANFYQVNEGEQTFKLYDFDLHNFSSTFGLELLQTHNALKLLESQNLIHLSEAYFQPAKIRILLNASDLFRFQERNTQIDEFIKTILRIYGGEIFSSYVTIHENELVSALRSTYSVVIDSLNYLHKHKAIEYIPQKTLPQFSFLQYRYDADRLPLNYKEIATRKANDRRALKAMTSYAMQTHRCRMAQIQDYFDEKNPKNCGKCDVCKHKTNLGLDSEMAVNVREKIGSLLPASISNLEKHFSAEEKELAGKILKAALSSGELKMDSFGLIYLAESAN